MKQYFARLAKYAAAIPAALIIATTAAHAGITREDLFAPDPARPANHASTITLTPNGDLLACWFGGSKEGLPDVAVWCSRKTPAAASWAPAYKLIDDPARAEGNALLFTDSKGTVWLFFVRKFAEQWNAWSQSKVFMVKSSDSGFTWSPETEITHEPGYMIRNNLTELPDGRLALPFYIEGKVDQSLFWLSGDGFATHEEYRVPVSSPGNFQPAFVFTGGSRVLMYARNTVIGSKIWYSDSDDLGKNWTPPARSKFPNPASGIDAIALKSGAIVLAYNHSPLNRSPLSVAISTDGGSTWLPRKDIETAKMEYSYPFLYQSPDGVIHLIYTADDRRTIRHVTMTEDWLKSFGGDPR